MTQWSAYFFNLQMRRLGVAVRTVSNAFCRLPMTLSVDITLIYAKPAVSNELMRVLISIIVKQLNAESL